MRKTNNLNKRINKLKVDIKSTELNYSELDRRISKLESDVFRSYEEVLYNNLKYFSEHRNCVDDLAMHNLGLAYEFVTLYGVPRRESIRIFNELTVEFVSKV